MPRLRDEGCSHLLNASFFAYASGGGHPADKVTACVVQRVDLGMDLPQHPARAGRVDLLGTCIFPGGLSSSCRWSSFADPCRRMCRTCARGLWRQADDDQRKTESSLHDIHTKFYHGCTELFRRRAAVLYLGSQQNARGRMETGIAQKHQH